MRVGGPARAPLQRAALLGKRGDLQREGRVWVLTCMGALQAPTCFGSWLLGSVCDNNDLGFAERWLPGSMCDNSDLGLAERWRTCWPPACQQVVHCLLRPAAAGGR